MARVRGRALLVGDHERNAEGGRALRARIGGGEDVGRTLLNVGADLREGRVRVERPGAKEK